MSNKNKQSSSTSDKASDSLLNRILLGATDYTYYNHLIPEHLKVVMDKYSDKQCILIYKGFPFPFLNLIHQHFPPVSTVDLFVNGRLDLESIKSGALNTFQLIYSLKTRFSTMSYEELIVLTKQVNPGIFVDKQFVVVENNFLSLYPNPSSHNFQDLERAIESDREFQDDELFNEFYTNATIIDNITYIQYPELDIEDWNNVTKLDFFAVDLDSLNPIQLEEGSNTAGFLQFQIDSPHWTELKFKLYAGASLLEPLNVILDTPSLKDRQSLSELCILKEILQAASIEHCIYHRKDSYKNDYRPELIDLLRTYWKSDGFRNLRIYDDPDISKDLIEISQGAICEHVIKQSETASTKKLHEDIFLTAPTGAGKSVLFQIPAIYLAEKYQLITLVVSPLKALMLDQVTALKDDRGYPKVGFINSDISIIERDNTLDGVKSGAISILYLSPELLLSYSLEYFIGNRKVGLLVIDEAHLVTTWGRDFRVDYWFLGNYIRRARKFSDFSFPVFAVTATAVYNGPNDMVFDTIHSLSMKNCKKYIGYVRRDDITFDIRPFELPPNSPHANEKVNKTTEIIREFIRTGRKAIVYFPWISTIGDVTRMLNVEERAKTGEYHSRADVNSRVKLLGDFKSNQIKVVLATKAFGMGVDISDVEEVYHHSPSGSIPDYIQEIGRVARSKDIQGVAATDFNGKDLKFSNILFGLSSLKQWQVRMVLEKIYNVYRVHRRRNFLVSVDDFAHIFPNNEDPEQKVKSALLVLEKDMLARFRYNALVVRPKSLFSTVYARINNAEKKSFLGIYGQYISEEASVVNTRSQKIGRNTVLVPNGTANTTVLKIQLDKIWEEFFPDSSFPELKHRFFMKGLFEGFLTVAPQMKLQIFFNDTIANTLERLTNLFDTLERILTQFHGHYFTQDELLEALKKSIKDENVPRNLSNLLIAMYSEVHHFGSQGTSMMSDGAFIQKRNNPVKKKDEFRVISGAFGQVKSHARQRYRTLFGNSTDQMQVTFIPADTEKSKEVIKLAYMMEIFGLCTYEIIGGDQPQIFIRINDPIRITRLAKNRHYLNSVVDSVERRYGMNSRLMSHFFRTPLTNEQRWEFIEDYFLGGTEEQLTEFR